MKRYFTYLNERSPLAALSILSLGSACSAMAFYQEFSLSTLMLSLIINNLIFILLRLCDEMKDFQKDQIINPSRPLPRGLFSVDEFKKLILLHFFLLLISVVVVGVLSHWLAAGALLLCTLFAWLMYKEFYISQDLTKSPILYALTHQLITLPIFAWPTLMGKFSQLNPLLFFSWLIINFGASFTFEICRKLDPDAHQLAQTYAHHYGNKKTLLFILILLSISTVSAYLSHNLIYLGPFLAFLLVSLISWFNNNKKYQAVAGASALFSLICLWYPAIDWVISIWRSK